MRAQAAIQLQFKLQGASQHRGTDLAVVDCTRVPCRSSAFDCVLDKARCLCRGTCFCTCHKRAPSTAEVVALGQLLARACCCSTLQMRAKHMPLF